MGNLDEAGLEDLRVLAVGVWQDGCLTIHDSAVVVVRLGPQRPARVEMADLGASARSRETYARRVEAESSLMAEGVLLDVWRVAGSGADSRRMALATDVDRVEQVLSRDQMRVDATLVHVPSDLERRLRRFPPDMLALNVLIRPAPVPAARQR